MKKIFLALAAASLSASAALALSVVSHVQQTSLYKPSTVRAAGFNVEMHGTPPGMTPADAVADLHGPAWAGGTALKLLPADARPGKGTRLVLIFNGASVPDESVCGEPGALGGGPAPAGTTLRVLAVYCSGNRLIARGALSSRLSIVRPCSSGNRLIARGALSSGPVSGAGDGEYRNAMQSLLTAMFPPQNMNISPFGSGI